MMHENKQKLKRRGKNNLKKKKKKRRLNRRGWMTKSWQMNCPYP